MQIVIIDYGMGNLRSVQKSMTRLGYNPVISSDEAIIEKADKLILPGVGHFGNGMRQLKELNLINALNKKVLEKGTPILGICLGMQLFSQWSEEGNIEGLGWIKAETKKFSVSDKIKNKIPHMGWNSLNISRSNSLISNIRNDELFYFVHSYHVVCYDSKAILSTTEYDYEFVSSVNLDNVCGTQFHPEKSHKQGMQILKNFAEL